jgi:hypothetical protein
MFSNIKTLRQTWTLLLNILYAEVEVCKGRLALLSTKDDVGVMVMLVATAGFCFLCRGICKAVSSFAYIIEVRMVRFMRKSVWKWSRYIYGTIRYQTLKKVAINISQHNPSPEWRLNQVLPKTKHYLRCGGLPSTYILLKLERQCTNNVTPRHVCVTIVAVEKQ